MDLRLSDAQLERREHARRFAAEQLAPWADRIDREQTTAAAVLEAMKASGYLGAPLPRHWGGGGFDSVSYGLVTEEIGKVCSSVRSLMTVHGMSTQTIARMATRTQQALWLPDLCSGRKIVAFALSEPNVGSATHTLQMQACERDASFVLNGTKRWITYGQIADCFLVFAQLDRKPLALLVDAHSEGLRVEPLTEMLGTRGSMLAQLHFENVPIPKENQLGPRGAGLQFVAQFALDHGRFSVAWGSTGIVHACLDACVSYARSRQQGEGKLQDYQLIRRQLTDMLVAGTAARALCYRSACLREQGDPRAVMETSLAKYYASNAAIRAATHAVHLHGGNGCSGDYPVGRYLRDATVMGIIEGTDEIHQLALASYALQRAYLE